MRRTSRVTCELRWEEPRKRCQAKPAALERTSSGARSVHVAGETCSGGGEPRHDPASTAASRAPRSFFPPPAMGALNHIGRFRRGC